MKTIEALNSKFEGLSVTELDEVNGGIFYSADFLKSESAKKISAIFKFLREEPEELVKMVRVVKSGQLEGVVFKDEMAAKVVIRPVEW